MRDCSVSSRMRLLRIRYRSMTLIFDSVAYLPAILTCEKVDIRMVAKAASRYRDTGKPALQALPIQQREVQVDLT